MSPLPSDTVLEATRPESGQPQGEPLGRRLERKKAAHVLVHELLAQGHSRQAIARHLGWGLNTVLRYATTARWQDTIRENRPRPSGLDPYKPYPDLRWQEGCTNAWKLWEEIREQGYPTATVTSATT